MMSNGLDSSVVRQENGGDGGQGGAQEESGTNLIVNYLPQTMTEGEMQSLFSAIGEVEHCKLIRNNVTGENIGYGFINYRQPEDAKLCINTLNGLRLHNKTIKVSYTRPSSQAIQGTNLYVSGLSKNMTQQELEALFSPYGRIITSRVLYDNISGLSKGIGFIRFDQRIEAERSIQELNGTIPKGCTEPISVEFAINFLNNNRAIPPQAPYLTPQATLRFAGPTDYPTGRFRHSPLAGDRLANSMLSGNTMNGSGWCIFIYNLAPTTGASLLWQLFGPFGAIQGVSVKRDWQTNKCKGFGFVTMTNYDEAVLAIQSLDGYTLGNRVLQVRFKTNKSDSTVERLPMPRLL